MSKRIEEDKELAKSQVEIQKNYIKQLKEWALTKEKEIGKKLSFYIETFGCQMNAHDSEKLIGILENIGYTQAEKEKEADFIIYNTCCIRENAETKIYSRIGNLKRLKQENPNLITAICGCMTQQNHVLEEIQKKYKKNLDIVFGTHNLYKFPELMQSYIETKSIIIDIWKEHKEIVEDLPSTRKYKFKACVNIMYGCNNFCTYCIVPYVRGRERSREVEDIIKEVETLAKDRVKEITVLGQNVNSYGKTLDNPITFAELLKIISNVEGIERIRFMTSHPKDLSDELIQVIKENKKICNYIHLPMQSGSTEVLRKMNRIYTKEQYLELAIKIKNEIPDVGITTDIIVGFPGETEQDFEDTLDVVRKVRFDSAFTFIYSKREGTKAASMENHIPEEVSKERFNRLKELVDGIINENSKKYIGKEVFVLPEEVSKNGESIISGRTDSNHIVHFKGDKSLIGEIVKVKIIDASTFYLVGEQIK